MNFFNKKNRKAAIEMSMTTIVTIVLVVVTLVLALVLIRTIFTSSTNAVTEINTAIQNQINQLFSSENSYIVVYPADQSVTISRGSTPSGFAFAIKNPNNQVTTFTYNVNESSMTNCGSLTASQANSYLIAGQGTFTAGPGTQSDTQLFKFDVPKGAPACTITYNLFVTDGAQFAHSANLFVTLQ